MRTKREIALFAIGIVLFRICLDLVYFNILSVYFIYDGYLDRRNTLGLIVSWVVVIASFFHIKRILITSEDRVSNTIIIFIYFLNFIPFTTTIYAGTEHLLYIILNCIFWFVFVFMTNMLSKKPLKLLPTIKTGTYTLNNKLIATIGLASVFIVFYVSWRYTGFRLKFNFLNIYDIRLEAREYSWPTVLIYLYSWTNAINNVLFAYCLIKKKNLFALLFFLTQMLSFGVAGNKGVFLLPFLVFLVVKIYQNHSIVRMKIITLYGLLSLSLFSIIEYIIYKSFYLASLFVRRVMFTPCILNRFYFDFFSNHEPDFYRGSFLRFFGATSPYSSYGGIPYMIGSIYYNSPIMSCNNGLFSDAFSNMGYIGIIVLPIIISLFLYLFDRSTLQLDSRITFVSCIYLAMNLIASVFTTVLLTHGFLVLIFMTWFMRREGRDSSVTQKISLGSNKM